LAKLAPMIPTFIALFPSIELNRLSDAASRAEAATSREYPR
jgi:hypothetical protein